MVILGGLPSWLQSNENAELTGAFNCIYGEAKCFGLDFGETEHGGGKGIGGVGVVIWCSEQAQPYKWKILFSLNIAFRLLICRRGRERRVRRQGNQMDSFEQVMKAHEVEGY